MKIRTKDVARIANVSTATVSRVINGSPNVSEKTRQRVLMAIESLNYKPDIFAKTSQKKDFMKSELAVQMKYSGELKVLNTSFM